MVDRQGRQLLPVYDDDRIWRSVVVDPLLAGRADGRWRTGTVFKRRTNRSSAARSASSSVA
jgi:hypothetical protein